MAKIEGMENNVRKTVGLGWTCDYCQVACDVERKKGKIYYVCPTCNRRYLLKFAIVEKGG